jgi:hypothetical protein
MENAPAIQERRESIVPFGWSPLLRVRPSREDADAYFPSCIQMPSPSIANTLAGAPSAPGRWREAQRREKSSTELKLTC